MEAMAPIQSQVPPGHSHHDDKIEACDLDSRAAPQSRAKLGQRYKARNTSVVINSLMA